MAQATNSNTTTHNNSSYTASNIEVLEGVEAIRRNAGMYIGATGSHGLVQLIYEAFANAVDEAISGHGKLIRISLDAQGWVTVEDEGRGIPFDLKEYKGQVLPAATVIITTIHAGGKFDNNNSEKSAYSSSGGLHGVGTTAINAFASRLELDSWRDSQHFRQIFKNGEPQPHTIEATRDHNRHGTRLRWKADLSLFDAGAHYDTELLISRLKPAAYLNPGLRIVLSLPALADSAVGNEDKQPLIQEFYSQTGLVGYVLDLLREMEGAEAKPLFAQPILLKGERDGVSVTTALVISSESDGVNLHSYANSIRTSAGGTHESGFKFAITRSINDLAASGSGSASSSQSQSQARAKAAIAATKGKPKAKALPLAKSSSSNATPPSYKAEVIQQGLYAVIAVQMPRPQFTSQTKERLSSAEVEGIVRSVIGQGLSDWFAANPKPAREWLRRIELAQKAKDEAAHYEQLVKAGQKEKGQLIDRSISDKFVRCASKNPAECELLIVEGDSAGGSAVQGRNATTQAILKLRGKPLNVAGAKLSAIVGNREILTLLNVLGTGFGTSFDITKLAFHKIILCADADVDGLHIQCLLLTFFHEMLPDLIHGGYIYIAQPPLYKVVYKKQDVWLLDDVAKDVWVQKHSDAAGLEFKRFKGLGEMNPKDLKETTLDPARRTLVLVTLDEVDMAKKLVFQLMESKDASVRRDFLEKHGGSWLEQVEVHYGQQPELAVAIG